MRWIGTELDPRTLLLALLALFTVVYVAFVAVHAWRRRREGESIVPTSGLLGTGFVADFLDTLGIGSFATTTAIFRHWKMVKDEKLPGTLNAGHCIPTIAEAFIFTAIVPVGMVTLVGMIGAAIVGSWLGAGVVSRWPQRRIQYGMALTLAGAGALMLLTLFDVVPAGGDALSLHGSRLALGLAGNFVLGALMTIGIGLYAPCMILVYMLGMQPTAAFPIMMGSCAFLMPVAGGRFIRARSVDMKAVLGLAIGGIPGVLMAAYVVKSLPLTAVKWLVVLVVAYTAWGLWRAARRGAVAEPETAPAPALG